MGGRSIPPGIADPGVLVQDHERQAILLEVVTDRQARLASADYHGSELLIAHSISIQPIVDAASALIGCARSLAPPYFGVALEIDRPRDRDR